MTLQLNQQSVPGQDIKVTIKLPFGDSDLSGQSSSTTSAETGTKAKELSVSLIVPFENKEWLTAIDILAEAQDKTTGARTVYRVGHDAANAIKFYEAKFSRELTIRELEDTQGWQVGFMMKEHLSVPERKSQREPIKPAKQQGGGGDVALDKKITDNPDIPPNTELSAVEKILSMANNAFGSVIGNDTEEGLTSET